MCAFRMNPAASKEMKCEACLVFLPVEFIRQMNSALLTPFIISCRI